MGQVRLVDWLPLTVRTGAACGRRQSASAIRLNTLPMLVVVTGVPWPAASVMVADAVLVASAWLMAVMVMVCGSEIAAGAVYRPAALMLPTPVGFKDHVTPVFTALPTEARNCCVWPLKMVVTVGVKPIETGGNSVTTADADFVLSAWLVAVTVTTSGVAMVDGAV